MIPLNTAFNREIDLVDTSGAAVTGATFTITLSKDGGPFTAITPTVTDRGAGAYNLALTAAHNNTVGSHTLYVTAPGAVPQFVYDQVVVAVPDEIVEGSTTIRQSLRLANSANGGKVSGAGTGTIHLRDLADTKDRVTSGTDAEGNRLTVVRDLS